MTAHPGRVQPRRMTCTTALSYEAVLFDLDGVLTPTAALHARCWTRTFDDFLDEWGRSSGTLPDRFDAESDYLAYVDGKLRDCGVRDFLRARGIDAPEALVERALRAGGTEAFPGTVRWLRALRDAGTRTAVVSSSTNAGAVLRAAGIHAHFDVIIDGREVERLGLSGKPAPDVVVEDALAGVAAGRAG